MASLSRRTSGFAAWNGSVVGSGGAPGTAARTALAQNTMNSTVSTCPNATITTRPPDLVTRTSSARPRAMSGNNETPLTETATSKESSSRSRS